ncbi:protocatechuate 3,4-dioxygenase subunit alpha [Pelagibius sp.]|uniref:protocatechuate 3,4-dioxygenase subunit alpha n=1 Tax=Pelagibius sp. TaxID=1931238 RepID=UPI003BB11BF3
MENKLTINPEATLGPFYPETYVPADANDLTRVRYGQPRATGQLAYIEGMVRDSEGVGRPRILIEVWQANAAGRYRHPKDQSDLALDPNFDGWGRFLTRDDGSYDFRTVIPGAHAAADGTVQAPHLKVSLFGTGFDRLQTAIFFPGTEELGDDPIMKRIGDRSALLVAKEVETLTNAPESVRCFRFDFTVRGENETPFFLD